MTKNSQSFLFYSDKKLLCIANSIKVVRAFVPMRVFHSKAFVHASLKVIEASFYADKIILQKNCGTNVNGQELSDDEKEELEFTEKELIAQYQHWAEDRWGCKITACALKLVLMSL